MKPIGDSFPNGKQDFDNDSISHFHPSDTMDPREDVSLGFIDGWLDGILEVLGITPAEDPSDNEGSS